MIPHMTNQEKPQFTAETILADLAQDVRNQEILHKFHVPCLTCPMGGLEMTTLKLGDVCRMYGLDLDGILKELNK